MTDIVRIEACPRCNGSTVNSIGEPCPRCDGTGIFVWHNDGSAQKLQLGSFGHGPAKTMCKECPLARTCIAGYLGGYTPENYVKLLQGDADVACHLSPGFHERPQNYATMRSCTGVAHYRANTSKVPRGRNAAAAAEKAGPNREDVFASAVEFLAHHNVFNNNKTTT